MDIEELKNYISDLSNQDNFDVLKSEAEGLLQNGTVSEISALLNFLSDKLNAQAKIVEAKNPQMYEQYESYWALLAFNAFIGMSGPDQDNLLRHRMLYAIQKGFSPDILTYKYFSFYDSQEFISSLFRNFEKSLELNEESLGTNPIDIDGRKFLPQVKYWLQDYSKFPTTSAKRGSIDRLNYINKSQNPRFLTQGQRQQLLLILKLYDDFINCEPPVIKVKPMQSRPAPVSPAPARSAMNNGFPQTIDIQQKLEELNQRTTK